MATPLPSRRRLLLPLASLVLVTACGPDQTIQDPSGQPGTPTYLHSRQYGALPAGPGLPIGPQAGYCTGGCPTDSSIIDFEGLGPANSVHQLTTQFSLLGVTFDSAIVAVAPAYDTLAFPARSGVASATADIFPVGVPPSGILYLATDGDAQRVRGYVTSTGPVALRCYNAVDSLIGQVTFAGGNVYSPANLPVEVSAAGIRSCQFDGASNTYSLDDLTVVWVAPVPTLVCTSVVRGATGTCTVTGADSVLVWEFTGILAFNPDSVNPVVVRADTTASATWGAHPDSVWSGPGAISGSVSARIRLDTTESTLTTSWVVLPRTAAGWHWDPADWHLSHDTVAICPYVDFVLPFKSTAPAHKGVVGYNRRQSDCTTVGSIEPNIRDTLANGSPAAAGITLDSVSSGPNKQIWFVKSAAFTMDRATEMDPWFRPGGPSIPVLDSVDYTLCRDSMGLVGTPPISVNLYSYNQICRGFDPQPWIAGILNHEGYGTQNPLDPATANGHEARRRLAALEIANDPRALVEPLVHPFSAHGLRGYVYQSVFDADLRISGFASDATGFVKDNYIDTPIVGDCGYLWVLFKPEAGHTNKWYRFMEMQYFQADTTLPKKCP